MSKQDVLLKGVNIPEGYEATGEYRNPSHEDSWLVINGQSTPFAAEGQMNFQRIILRRIEPDHVKLARELVKFYPDPACPSPQRWVELSKRIIADWESSK